MTSFRIYPVIERDPRERARAPSIAPPLVTSVAILYPQGRRKQTRIERLALPVPTTLGRAGDIAIDDVYLNERHAELVLASSGLCIRDLDTTNHTFVNARSVREDSLRVGDIVMIGQERVWFRHTSRGMAWPAGAAPLLDAIRTAPDDDGPRSVLADLLTDRGDPRGEFIACQLSGAHDRADELLAAHGHTWAGPFVTPVHDWTFSRGFIDAIYVDDLREAEPLRAAHPHAELRLARPLADLDQRTNAA